MEICNAKTYLKQNGLKVTRQRQILLQAIIDSEKIFSATSLHENVKECMDHVTIYRILKVFLDNNIIREVVSHDTIHFYELSCEHKPVHPHFICKKCKSILCLDDLNEKNISNLKKTAKDNAIEYIQFSGTCKNCQ